MEEIPMEKWTRQDWEHYFEMKAATPLLDYLHAKEPNKWHLVHIKSMEVHHDLKNNS